MEQNFYDLKARDNHSELVKMSEFKNKVLLIVVMSSEISNYEKLTMLEKLYKKYNSDGLEILLFPTDQFKEKQSLSAVNLDYTLHQSFNIDLPLMEKVDVKGETKHPLFSFLTEGKIKIFKNEIKRNFTMFLISRSGDIIKRLKHDQSFEDLSTLIDSYLKG